MIVRSPPGQVYWRCAVMPTGVTAGEDGTTLWVHFRYVGMPAKYEGDRYDQAPLELCEGEDDEARAWLAERRLW